jgi:hypothetical protein
MHFCVFKGVSGKGYIFIQRIGFHLHTAPCPGLKVGELGFIIALNAYTSSIFNMLAQ